MPSPSQNKTQANKDRDLHRASAEHGHALSVSAPCEEDPKSLERRDAAQAQGNTASDAPPYTLGLMVLAGLPTAIRELYWRFAKVPEERRLQGALAVAGIDSPARLCRAFLLKDSRNMIEVVTHRRVRQFDPAGGFAACIELGIPDKQVMLDLALAAVSRHSTRVHEQVHSNISLAPLSEAERLQVALKAAEKEPFALVEKLAEYRIQDHEKLKEVVRGILRSDLDDRPHKSCLAALNPAQRFDEATRVELAMISAARNPYVLARDFKFLGITDSESCRRVAFAAAVTAGNAHIEDCRRTIAAHVKNFGITDQEELTRLAVLCAANSGGDTAIHIHHFGLVSEESRYLVALEAASSGNAPETFRRNLGNFGIDDKEKLRAIGTRHLLTHGWVCTPELKTFAFETREQRRGLGIAVTGAFGLPTFDGEAFAEILLSGEDRRKNFAYFMAEYGLTAREVREVILPLAASVRPSSVISALNDVGIPVKEQYDVCRMVVRASRDGLRAVREAQLFSEWDGKEIVQAIVAPALCDLQREWGRTKDPNLLREVANIFETILPARAALGFDIPRDDFNEDTYHRMLRVALGLKKVGVPFDPTLWDLEGVSIPVGAQSLVFASFFLASSHVAHLSSGMRVREGVRMTLELHDLPIHELSEQRFGRLCETFASAESSRGLRFCHALSFHGDVWRDSFQEALNLVTASSVLYKLTGVENKKALERVTKDNLASVRDRLANETQREFAAQFNLPSGKGVLELEQQWGDLSPLTILLGRFKGGRSAEVPVLREIAGRVLAGSFHDWKYDQQDKQLGYLTEEQLAKWRENPMRVSVVSADDAKTITDETQLRLANSIMERNVYAHIPESHIDALAVDLPPLVDAVRRSNLDEGSFAKEVRRLIDVVRDVKVLLDHSERHALFCYLKRFNGIKRGVASDLPAETAEQLKKDLGSIRDAVKERSVESQRRYVVVSTVTDDPKLLLTVGDLVNAASCQNYKTGSYVETLPGYVIDSNIKVMLSFVVAEGMVRSHFKLPRDAAFEIDRYQVKLDAPRLTLTLTDDRGVERELSLGKAVSRRILRAGFRMSDDKPTVMPEARYHQLHAVTSHIEAEQKRLLERFRRDCGFEVCDGRIKFPQSRNPSGVYSDAGGGKKTASFVVTYEGLRDSDELELNADED